MSDHIDETAFGRRIRKHFTFSTPVSGLELAWNFFRNGNCLEAFDVFEELLERYPSASVDILAEAYDAYQQLPSREDRYHLYQARHFNFAIKPSDKVLDVGSGNMPFPFATHLAELAVHDDAYGRAGCPFKYLDDKPVFECNVEALPFRDQEFDFVYCSHVLEHVGSPEKACQELMRVAKRGYIETPGRAKDLWLNTGKISNHRWYVENIDGTLVFNEYTPEDLEGLGTDLLLRMQLAPQTKREKALSALVYLKAAALNSMLLWEGSFGFEVRRRAGLSATKGEDFLVRDAQEANRRGESCFQQGDLQEARALFHKAIELDPNSGEGYNNLGVLYWQLGEPAKSRDCFEKAIEIAPGVQEYRSNYGDALNSWGKIVEASRLLLQDVDFSADGGCSNPEYRPKLRYSFGMIVLNGDDFIEYALKSVYDFAHEIIIVEGAVEEARFMTGADGGSRDNTLKIIEEFPDPENKITLIRGSWFDKTEQSNAYLRVATGDYVWQLDSDEVYKKEDLIKIDQILSQQGERIDMLSLYCFHFFHDFGTIGCGGRWDAPEDPFRRIFKREPGCYFSTHWPPTVVYPGDPEKIRGHLHAEAMTELGIMLYHYSYVTPKQVKEKIEYYARKGYSEAIGTDLFTWYDRVWSQWTGPGCEAEKLYGSHPNTRRTTWTEAFRGTHPEVIKSHPAFSESGGERPGAGV